MNINIKFYMEKILNECCEKGVFPGANLALITDKEEYYISSGNKAIVPIIEKNSIETIYDLASLTKIVVTTTIILQLVDEKKLCINTYVKDIFREFKEDGIKIIDLITHTSGLPADINLGESSNKKEITDKIFNCEKIYETGSRVVYSDIGFILLGFIIEKILGEPLDEIANKRIFKPLEMKDTCYCPLIINKKRCAPTEDSKRFKKIIRGESHDRKSNFMEGVSGHAGVFSTIKDLAKFAKMILNNGCSNGRRVLSRDAIKGLYTTITPMGEICRGFGYLTYDERSPFSMNNTKKSMLHTGFTGTSLLIDMEKRIAIILLSNRIHPSRENNRILEERKNIHDQILQIANL